MEAGRYAQRIEFSGRKGEQAWSWHATFYANGKQIEILLFRSTAGPTT